MRKLLLLIFFSGVFLFSHSQDFTNKGKDFWIGYGNHVRMFGGGVAETMELYITSDVNTTGKVEIASIGFSQNFSVTANQIVTLAIPRGAALSDEGLFNHGIHVTAQKPVVVYSFIYVSNISGATLCLPTATLGRDYYSINYTQLSNEPNSFSYFFALATDTGTTTVEIIPSQLTRGGRAAGVPFTVNLNQGQIYQVLSNIDLTGSSIRSINNGSGCKRIAVFNGSGKININAVGSNNSSDNLYQQMYPTSTWGKTYVTVPSINTSNPSGQYNMFRIFKSQPDAVVKLNGVVLPNAIFTADQYTTLPSTNQPQLIESDMPIMVAQYFPSQGTSGNSGIGDPEMIYLNPVEQTISSVTLNSMQPAANTNISQHFINAVVKTSPGAINSFKIDGIGYAANFTTHPNIPGYSYARIQVSRGAHTVICDTPFNAIAYGFGTTESYGYSAGTNLKDLYQFVSISNEYGVVNFPAGCKGSPFKFAMTFPYQPTTITWKFGGLFPDTTIATPVYDSSWVINGRTLYRYRMDKIYSIPNTGSYPISVQAVNPTTDGCSGLQEIEYTLQIFDRPIADFSFTHTGCVTDSVTFQDNTNGLGRSLIKWSWDFGDGTLGNGNTLKHLFKAPGNLTVKHSAITDIGCLSDTVSKVIPITDPPVASFAVSAVTCEKNAITFTDGSIAPSGTLVKWKWDFGDGVVINASNGNAVQHTYTAAGTYTVSLEVESNTGCRSFVFSKPVIVYPKPAVNFSLPTVCLPLSAQFTDLSTIADGSQAQFVYAWDFGDGQTSTLKDPLHPYSNAGPFNVRLTVTSSHSCVSDTLKFFNTIYPQPKLTATVTPEKCLGDSVRLVLRINNPSGQRIKSFQVTWGNEGAMAGTLAVPLDSLVIYYAFATTGVHTVKAAVNGDNPGGCLSDTVIQTVYINALPIAAFNLSTTSCVTNQVGFADQSTSADGTVNNWNWTFGNGNSSVLQNPATIYSTVGNVPVSLTVKSTKGCTSETFTRQIAVHPLPEVKFGTPEVCLADPFASFTDSSTISDHSESQFTYLWNFGDANANAGNPNTSTQQNPQHKFTAVGNYTIGLGVTSKDGCYQASSTSFTVNGSIPIANFVVNNTSSLCSNIPVSIKDASTVDFGSIVKVEVYWDYNNDPTAKTVEENPVAGQVYTHQYPVFGNPATRTFRVRYVAYSGINCINEITKDVVVNASPIIQFDPMSPVCEEVTPFQITAARETAGFTGTGTFSGQGIVNPGGLFDPSLAKPGIRTIRYTFSAANGCSSFAEQSVRVNPTPIVDAGPDRVVLEGGYIIIQAKATGNSLDLLWTPPTALDNTKAVNPKASPIEDITYRLTATSADGCVNRDDVFVKVLKSPKIPNAFTPNGDGINDAWIIEHLDSYPGCVVEVYNRYGQLVFHSTGYGKPWDGTYNGSALPVATYYWIINPKNGRAPMKGSVTIIR